MVRVEGDALTEAGDEEQAAPLARGLPLRAAEVCEVPAGPVSLMILKTPQKVRELARSVAKQVPVLAYDGKTAVFRDGRVITSDPEGATEHLNRLGWGSRRIDVVASFPRQRARPRSGFG